MTRGVELLKLFDTWAKSSPGGLRGRLCVSVFGGTTFVWWSVWVGPDGRLVTSYSPEPDRLADATLSLTSREVELVLQGRRLPKAEHLRFRGDAKVLRSFAEQVVKQVDMIGLRAGA